MIGEHAVVLRAYSDAEIRGCLNIRDSIPKFYLRFARPLCRAFRCALSEMTHGWRLGAVYYCDRSSTFTWHSARSPLMASSIRRGTGPLRLAKVVIVRPDIPSALAAADRVRPSSFKMASNCRLVMGLLMTPLPPIRQYLRPEGIAPKGRDTQSL